MILHEKQYLNFIMRNGIGKHDRVASSPLSYLSYLRSVSSIIQEDITPALLKNEVDATNIAEKIKGKRATSTIRNYCSAMHQYVKMVEVRRF